MKKAIIHIDKRRYTTNVDEQTIKMLKDASGNLEVFESDILITCIRSEIKDMTKKKIANIMESISKEKGKEKAISSLKNEAIEGMKAYNEKMRMEQRYNEVLNEFVGSYISRNEKKQFEQCASKLNINKSELLRIAIKEYLKNTHLVSQMDTSKNFINLPE